MGIAGFFIIGIVLHAVAPARPAAWWCAAAALTLAAYLLRRWRVAFWLAAGTSTIIAGLLAGQLEAFFYPATDISAFAADDVRLAQLEFRLTSEPRVLTYPFDPRSHLPPKQVGLATVTRVKTWNGWISATGDVLLQMNDPDLSLAAGQTLRAIGMLQRPSPAMNPGQFDWASYYREQRVLASFTVRHAENISIVSRGHRGPIQWWQDETRGLLDAGFTKPQQLDHALLRAILLGDADPELRDVQEQFRATGTSHHLTVSGLHVMVLGAVVVLLCRLLRVRPRWSAWIGAIFTVCYGLAAMPHPPVSRAVILSLLFCHGITSRRSVDSLQLLAIAAIAMLAYHPMDLYTAGFQLAFITLFFLVTCTGPTARWLLGLRDEHRALAPPNAGAAAAVGRWADAKLLHMVAGALVAWSASMPLIAFHFGQINPWAIPAGLLLAPFTLASLLGAAAKVVLTALLPFGATQWAAWSTGPVKAMRWVLAELARLPCGDIPVPRPPVWEIAAFYALFLIVLIPWPGRSLRWLSLAGPVAAVLGMFFLPFQSVAWLRQAAAGGELRVTLLAIGAGQCCVVEPPSGRVMMIDAGSDSLSDVMSKCLVPFLHARGITAIDTVVMSHGDNDHISAVDALAKGWGVHEILTGPYFRAFSTGTSAALLHDLDAMERPPRIVLPGQIIPLGRDTSMAVLWPPPGAKLGDNDSGVVLKLSQAGKSILFPADIQEAGMRGLLAHPELLKADVLVAPHHGSSEMATPAFVSAVDPAIVLSSNDRSLTHKQVEFESMIGRRPLYRTNRGGALTVTITRDGTLAVTPFLAVASANASRPE